MYSPGECWRVATLGKSLYLILLSSPCAEPSVTLITISVTASTVDCDNLALGLGAAKAIPPLQQSHIHFRTELTIGRNHLRALFTGSRPFVLPWTYTDLGWEAICVHRTALRSWRVACAAACEQKLYFVISHPVASLRSKLSASQRPARQAR
jgi:hypothetical protein